MANKVSKISRASLTNYATYLFVVAAYIILIILSKTGGLNSKMTGMLVPITAYVVMAISLNLVVGIMGELSLGHAGFMAIGAFCGTTATMALVNAVPNDTIRLFIGLLVGAIFGGIFGFLIGIPVLRLNGDYLAIVTLAFGEIIKSIFANVYAGVKNGHLAFSMLENKLNLGDGDRIIIEGAMGIRSIPRISTFTIGFILIMICLAVVFNMVKSRTGRAIMALRDNRIAAESVGIPAFRFKIIAFTISAAMAGAAGALFGNNYSSLVSTKFNIDTSILILVFVVLGGQGNMLGSIIAAAALTILPEALRSFADYRMLTYAIILILVMLIKNNPEINYFFTRIFKKAKKKAKKAMQEKEAAK